MEDMFISVLNMSLTASYVIAVLMLARLFLKKAPKIVSYALWAVAGFRLVFPFSFESVFSLIPFKSEPIPADIAMQPIPRVDSGIPVVDNVVSQVLPAATPAVSVNPLQIWLTAGSYLWLAGIAVMLIYSVVSIILLKRRLNGARLIEDNIYEADNLKTPFVLGLLRPRIYIPTGLSEEEKRYIILHERTHIRRHDHIAKFFAYFILCLHWYNPLVWVAFLLMGADMEMSCDERVLKEMGGDIKKAYSTSLLSLATGRHLINGSPLAFGEGNIKGRIKNVLNFKKPAAWVIVVSVALAAALSVGFAVNRAGNANGNNLPKVADIERIVAGTPIEEVHRILGEPSGQLSGFWGDIYVLEDSKQAVIYYDSKGAVEQVKLSIDENWYGNFDGKEMTLNDVQELARKGEALTFDDFKGFKGGNASSNLDYRIMLYGVEGSYRLIVRTDGKQIDNVYMESIWEDGGIDIRYKDVDEFIKSHPSSETTGLQPSAPEWSPEQSIDIVGIPELDYASDDIVIFHGYFGLFVYDLDSRQIIRSLDLQPLNCAAIQGDDYCEVTVGTDGNTVQLHRLSSENMYIYTVSDNTLRETTYERMSDRFGSNFVPIEDVVDTERLGNYSSNAVKFDTGEYGFLHISDWTLGTLSYIRGDMIYRLFDKEGNADRATPEPTAGSLKLWEQDGWTYWLQSRSGEEVKTGDGRVSSAIGNRLGRLYRTNAGEQEVLDEFVEYQADQDVWQILPAGNKVVFVGYTGDSYVELKGGGSIISMNPDGSDRRVFEPKFHTAANLCYDGQYLYYEGWTNARAFPRPLNRLNPDLTGSYKLADIDGVFITYRNGYAYYVNKKGNQVRRIRLDGSSKTEETYREDFEISLRFTVRQTGPSEYLLTSTDDGKTFTLTID